MSVKRYEAEDHEHPYEMSLGEYVKYEDYETLG
jgi:hypothetical protein